MSTIESLEAIASKPAVVRVTEMLHFLIVHARNAQLFHELRYVRNEERFADLLARALKEVHRHKEAKSEEYEEYRKIIKDVGKIFPSSRDLTEVLGYFQRHGKAFVKVLTSGACSFCPACREEG